MSSKYYCTSLKSGVNTKNNMFLENPMCRQFILGVLALMNIPYKVVATRVNVSKSHYYASRVKAEKLLSALFGTGNHSHKLILVTDTFIERCVMGLSLYCRAPIEGIVQFFDQVVVHHVSKGTIGNIRKRAAEKAAAFDESIQLDAIREIATDEIFQQGKPVLTGIDIDTNYVICIDAETDRSGETWRKCFDRQKSRGLAPDVNVSDGASGLKKGVEQAFPGMLQQADVFHMLRNLGREVKGIEKYALSELKAYYDAQYKIFVRKRGKPDKKVGNLYWKLKGEIDGILHRTDEVLILFDWLQESVGFTGDCYERSKRICEWILDEMSQRFPERQKYQQAIQSFRAHLGELLSFLLRLEQKMAEKSKDFPRIDISDFRLMYQQRRTTSNQAWECMEVRLWRRFGNRLPEAREVLEKMLRSTHRASSMIENLNGRLRCFMNLKREIPEQFLILIKVYFNTKKQMRSRHEEWKGTSALERLTGKRTPEFLDIVCAPVNYII